MQAWRWLSEIQACCQIQDTKLGVLTAIYFSSCSASSEKFCKSVSKWSRITWYKHCGVVFNTLSLICEIFRVLINVEIERSFMQQSKGQDEQVSVMVGTGIFLFVTMPWLALWPILPPLPIGAVFLSRAKGLDLDFHRSYGRSAECSGAPQAIKR